MKHAKPKQELINNVRTIKNNIRKTKPLLLSAASPAIRNTRTRPVFAAIGFKDEAVLSAVAQPAAGIAPQAALMLTCMNAFGTQFLSLQLE